MIIFRSLIANAYGKSLILDCSTHIHQKIEITTVEDFENKVPFGGCSVSKFFFFILHLLDFSSLLI